MGGWVGESTSSLTIYTHPPNKGKLRQYYQQHCAIGGVDEETGDIHLRVKAVVEEKKILSPSLPNPPTHPPTHLPTQPRQYYQQHCAIGGVDEETGAIHLRVKAVVEEKSVDVLRLEWVLDCLKAGKLLTPDFEQYLGR